MSDMLDQLNLTELAHLIRQQTSYIVRRSVPRERLVEILRGGQLTQEEVAGTMETRKTLQLYIEKNWTFINSQLPCKGENRGKCTIYPCSEGRHMDCYTGNLDDIRMHMRLPDEP